MASTPWTDSAGWGAWHPGPIGALVFCWLHARPQCRVARRPAAQVAGERLRQAQCPDSRGEDDRPGPDFSERDRDLLTLLRPHLHQAYLDAECRRRPALQLTLRHWELLRLVAAGHTNAQIARRLDVTEKTVGKHLENIYTRLHVSSRTAAVTRAFPDGATLTASVHGGSAN